jgi:hypothetical protein
VWLIAGGDAGDGVGDAAVGDGGVEAASFHVVSEVSWGMEGGVEAGEVFGGGEEAAAEGGGVEFDDDEGAAGSEDAVGVAEDAASVGDVVECVDDEDGVDAIGFEGEGGAVGANRFDVVVARLCEHLSCWVGDDALGGGDGARCASGAAADVEHAFDRSGGVFEAGFERRPVDRGRKVIVEGCDPLELLDVSGVHAPTVRG